MNPRAKAEALAREYATRVRYPFRCDGQEVRTEHFNEERFESFIAGYLAHAKECEKLIAIAKDCMAQIKDQKTLWPGEVDTLDDALAAYEKGMG